MNRFIKVLLFVLESLFIGSFTIFAVWTVLNHGPIPVRIIFSVMLALVIGQAFVIADKTIGGERH